MRIRTRLATTAMVVTMLCWSAHSQTSTLTVRAERDLLASINQARRAQGLPPLRWDETLAAAARHHAEVMAEHGSAQHAFEGEPSLSARVKQAGARFTWLSENVTQGPTPDFIHAQFMKSPPHRAKFWTEIWIRLEWVLSSRTDNCSQWKISRRHAKRPARKY